MSERENMLRTIFFKNPAYIPVSYVINNSYYFENDPEDVIDLKARHPLLFPDFKRPERGLLTFDIHTIDVYHILCLRIKAINA